MRGFIVGLPLALALWALIIGGVHVHGAASRGELVVLHLGDR